VLESRRAAWRRLDVTNKRHWPSKVCGINL
jgi:hypothetical protein